MRQLLLQTLCLSLVIISSSKKAKEKPDWAKKPLSAYSDADLERLLDQWEEDEEPIPPGELPEGHRTGPCPPWTSPSST